MTPPRNPAASSELARALWLRARNRTSAYYARIIERAENGKVN